MLIPAIRLAQGVPSPSVDPSEAERIRGAVDEVLALALDGVAEMEAEASLVAQGHGDEIKYAYEVDSEDVPAFLSADAAAMEAVLVRLASGPAASYMSASQRGLLASLRSRVATVGAHGRPPSGHAAAVTARLHAALHSDFVGTLESALETMVVEAEASSIDVREPSERAADKKNVVVVVAIVAAVGVAIWALA